MVALEHIEQLVMAEEHDTQVARDVLYDPG